MDNGILVRYSAPTKYDSAEYGQIWRQQLDNRYEQYIQVSKDEEKPEWIKMGVFLEKALCHKFYDETFIKECLKQYTAHGENTSGEMMKQ